MSIQTVVFKHTFVNDCQSATQQAEIMALIKSFYKAESLAALLYGNR